METKSTADNITNATNCIYSQGSIHNCTNGTSSMYPNNGTMLMPEDDGYYEFERYVRIVIPIIFSIIVALGLVGNLLVIVVILINQQMRSTTNLLILNLAFADLCFIIFCVPFTATSYAMPVWQFGVAWCKIHKYLIYVCAYASVYTLVIMSLDRYLAVVHPIASMSVRNQTNTIKILLIMWTINLLGHIPLLLDYNVHGYPYYNEYRSACLSKYTAEGNIVMLKIFFGTFFFFGYMLPLSLTCVLYGLMLKRLLYGVVPGGSQRAESIRSKKRVTKMVVIVVAIFALCWLPIQVIFMVQNFGNFPTHGGYIMIQMAANCFAYMNSCVNPILYAFLSDNFRRSFYKLLCCGNGPYQKVEYERTNIRIEKSERTGVSPVNTNASKTTSTTTLQTYCNNSEHGVEPHNCCTQTEV